MSARARYEEDRKALDAAYPEAEHFVRSILIFRAATPSEAQTAARTAVRAVSSNPTAYGLDRWPPTLSHWTAAEEIVERLYDDPSLLRGPSVISIEEAGS